MIIPEYATWGNRKVKIPEEMRRAYKSFRSEKMNDKKNTISESNNSVETKAGDRLPQTSGSGGTFERSGSSEAGEICGYCHDTREISTDEEDGEGHTERGVGTRKCVCQTNNKNEDHA